VRWNAHRSPRYYELPTLSNLYNNKAMVTPKVPRKLRDDSGSIECAHLSSGGRAPRARCMRRSAHSILP